MENIEQLFELSLLEVKEACGTVADKKKLKDIYDDEENHYCVRLQAGFHLDVDRKELRANLDKWILDLEERLPLTRKYSSADGPIYIRHEDSHLAEADLRFLYRLIKNEAIRARIKRGVCEGINISEIEFLEKEHKYKKKKLSVKDLKKLVESKTIPPPNGAF